MGETRSEHTSIREVSQTSWSFLLLERALYECTIITNVMKYLEHMRFGSNNAEVASRGWFRELYWLSSPRRSTVSFNLDPPRLWS